uniref:Motilin/ghrelin domain-containing protein n=1 Tax=Anas platyrhynchos platyrhynchos TaxID=8840 RepID=U3IC45_ANAPP
MASLLLVYVVSMLAEQTEGFVPFFTQSDFRKMQEKERNREQKKSLTPLQQLDEEGLAEQADADVATIQPKGCPMGPGNHQVPHEKPEGVIRELTTCVKQQRPFPTSSARQPGKDASEKGFTSKP